MPKNHGPCSELGDWRGWLVGGPLENERFLGTFGWKGWVGSRPYRVEAQEGGCVPRRKLGGGQCGLWCGVTWKGEQLGEQVGPGAGEPGTTVTQNLGGPQEGAGGRRHSGSRSSRGRGEAVSGYGSDS